MSILGNCFSALCCCLPYEPLSDRERLSKDLKRLSDWRAHPTLRQLDLEKHIADGGFSEVWLARKRSTGEELCLKVVNLRKPGLQPAEVEVLRGEARYLRLLDQPSLLRCLDTFETKYHLVMVLEYLSGGQMLDHLHRVDHYSEAQAGRLFAQIASAVAYMHNLNIVHRDIKPENVMFVRPIEESVAQGRSLRVKLIDLGMATVLVPPETPEEKEAAARARKRQRKMGGGALQQQPHRALPRGCMGSPGFIAPEVVHGAPHSLAMDVYSLGVLLFAMLTGRKPFSLKDSRNLSYAERSILEAPGLKDPIYLALSPSARDLLLAMMADDPQSRPTCAEVMRHPFIQHCLAASGAALRHTPLDDVIKRRMAQLALLRRFRGLSFAMMASRNEGQDLTDFTKQLTDRRKALHRDLLVRARTRRSLELHHKKLQQQQQLGDQGQGQGRTSERGSSSKRPRTTPQLQGLQSSKQTAAHPTSPPDRRFSVDSVGSGQPLLLQHQRQPSQDTPHSLHLTTSDSNGDALNRPRQQTSQADAQPRLSHLEPRRRSLDSLTSSVSSSQALVAGRGNGGGGTALPSHHASHKLVWTGATCSPCGAAVPVASPTGPSGSRRGLVYQRCNSHHPLQRPVLDPVAEPDEGTSAAAGGWAPVPPKADAQSTPRPAAAGGKHGSGWSNSSASQPGQKQQQRGGNARQRLAQNSELELVAADPLALIRELPVGTVASMWRAHSAPENLSASLLALGGDGSRSRDAGAGAGSATRPVGAGAGGDACMERLAMGADMRALSANSWTLDLLENAELLAALTGLPLAHQNSSASLDASVYSGTVYGGMTPLPYTGTLAAAQSAARTSSDGRGPGAGAFPLVQERKSGDLSTHQQLARAVLVAARASSSSHGGSAAATAAAIAALRAGNDGHPGRGGGEAWQRRIGSSTATAAAALDTPTRSAAVASERKPSFDNPWGAEPFLSPFVSLSQSDLTRLAAGGLGPKLSGEPRALFTVGGYGTPPPPPRPSLDGRAAMVLPRAIVPSRVGSNDVAAAAAAAAMSGGPEEPVPLVTVTRRPDEDPANLYGAPSCSVQYTSLHLSPSAQQLGVALPTATASRAAAAAVAAAAEAVKETVTPALTRRPSLALVDLDEHIAARRASLEESLHGGRLWLRMHSGVGGSSSPLPSPAGDTSNHRLSGGLIARSPGPATATAAPGALHEQRTLGDPVPVPPAAVMRTPPSLARITECSDLGDPSVRGARSAAAPGSGLAPRSREGPLSGLPPLPPAGMGPPPRHSAGGSQPAPGSSGRGDASGGGDGRPAGKHGGGSHGAPGLDTGTPQGARWRSPFEALAAAPVGEPAAAGKVTMGTGHRSH